MLAPVILARGPGESGSTRLPVPDYVFHDERFARASDLAHQVAAPGRAVAVRGDITPAWNGELKAAGRRSPLLLAGVTTESFYFCLKVMLRSEINVDAWVQRIDRDLYAWLLRTSHLNNDRRA